MEEKKEERESNITLEECEEILKKSRENVKELQKTLDRVFDLPPSSSWLRLR